MCLLMIKTIRKSSGSVKSTKRMRDTPGAPNDRKWKIGFRQCIKEREMDKDGLGRGQ